MKRFLQNILDNWKTLLAFLFILVIVPAFCIWIGVNDEKIDAALGETARSILGAIFALVQIIAVGIFVVYIIVMINKDIKKRERESYAEWVSNSIYSIRVVENRFRTECGEIIINAFSGRNIHGEIVVHKYWEEISELKKEYDNNLEKKLQELRTCSFNYVTSVPQYIEEEYYRDISDIADTFRNFGDFMLEQIKDITKGDFHWVMKL